MPEELEPFDPREYLLSGDWHTVLAHKGWEAAPPGIKSVKKTYRFPKGWFITLWVEEEREADDYVTFNEVIPSRLKPTAKVVAYGPHGNALGGLWCTDEAVPKVVAEIEELITQFRQSYKDAANAVGRVLGNAQDIVEGEADFDPRDYFAGYTGLMLELGYEPAGELAFRKVIQSPTTTFKVYVDGASDGHPGYLHVEGRPNDWMATGMWHQRGDFRTLLDHAFDDNPPTDYLKQLDAKLTAFNGTFEQIDGELMRDKSELLALTDRAWKARKAQKRVESIVDKLLDSEESFDAREYIMATPTIETFNDELSQMGWTARGESGWGWQWTKDGYEISGVDCDLKLFILPEFPHESHVEVQANYTDDNGFEHWERVDQEQGWWEMEKGESVPEYTARIEDGIARNLRVPETYEPEGPEEDWYRDR